MDDDVEPTDTPADDQGDDTADTFPRSYVEKLRTENACYRERARNADTYAIGLHTEQVRATGKLADSTDLEFREEHLEDSDALAAAVDELLARKPHPASRRPVGEIGQVHRRLALRSTWPRCYGVEQRRGPRCGSQVGARRSQASE